ncbi:hypothetical protein ACU8MB_32040 (plasmid) [Rhizobium leguminosarum]
MRIPLCMLNDLLLRFNLPTHVHGCSADAHGNMRSVIFLDHLDARAAGRPQKQNVSPWVRDEVDTSGCDVSFRVRQLRRFTIGGDMKHEDSLASQRVAYNATDFADGSNVHIANKSPMFDIGDFIDDGKVHIANKSPAFEIADFIDDGRVHIANKSPAFDIPMMDEAA